MSKKWIFLFIFLPCCANSGDFLDAASDAVFRDGQLVCTDSNADWDNDGISNGEEGCLENRDTDSDETPNWQDYDSDEDGILDEIEAGQKDSTGKCKSTNSSWPCDTDGDGRPDYIDEDSDNDSILDKHEDSNGDGVLGCCLTECNKPDVIWQQINCTLTADGCGQGQQCQNNACTPTADFKCSNGETSPLSTSTFGPGTNDNQLGTFICRDATEDDPKGRKAIDTRKSQTGDWHIAMEVTAKYAELSLSNPGQKEAAAVIDEEDANKEVAGFVLSKNTNTDNIQTELINLISALQDYYKDSIGTLNIRASGAQGSTHDKFDGIKGTILDISLKTASNVSSVRNKIISLLLNKPTVAMGSLPVAFGTSTTSFVLRFVTVRRFDQNNPQDTSKWRVLVMGAVASKQNYQEPSLSTGFIVDDLSGGTTLATASDEVVDECDVGVIGSLATADIIWVIDESGSMTNNRQDIVNNANDFFSRAIASGLDFRMGVTNVVNPYFFQGYAFGKFCSKSSTDPYDDGGTDRFLLPSEQSIFSACVKNPPGYEDSSEYGLSNAKEAVLKHLPRTANAPDKIRPDAQLVIIVATDEVPQTLSIITGDYLDQCILPTKTQDKVNNAAKEYIDLFSGTTNPEAIAIFHLIGGVCNNSCEADVAHGYKEVSQALGGQIGDVCQQNLGSTLQVIIDSIIGAASPVILEYVPISTSLAVALDAVQIPRSRTNGFDYRDSANSLAFINVQFQKGSQVVASYKRWKKQGIVE